jgi:hypothetical protein
MAVLQATTITGGLTMHGMAAGFMKINAEGAVVMDTNTYLSSGSYLPLSGGTMTGPLRFNEGGFGRIAYADNYHGMILRGIPNNAAGDVTVTDVTSLIQHSGDFRFYRTNGSINELYFQVNATAPYWRGNVMLHAGNYGSYALASDTDSEQQVGLRYLNWNDGVRRMNTDPRWNESGYDADLGCLHIWAWTAGGVAYGRAGIALYNGSAYQYLTTKASTTGMFVNNTQIVTNSGTWSISISGNAATASNSSQLNGLSKVQLWNNSGQNHSTYQSFGAIPNFGVWFMQGSSAGDSPQSGSQYYVQTQGLGNDYGYGTTPGNYALMTAVARDHARKYTYYRTLENGAWGSWTKGAAGYADEAASLSSMNISQFTNNSGYITSSALSSYLPLSGGTMTGAILSTASNQNFTNFTARNTSTAASMQDHLYYYIEARYNSGANGTNVYHWVRSSWEYNITNNYSDITMGAYNNGTSYGVLFRVSTDGQVYATNSFRAPIFYDSQDTTYYLDPNSTTSSILRGSVGLNNTSPINTAWGNATNTTQLSIYGTNYAVINLRGDAGGVRTYSMGVGDNQFYMAYDNSASSHRLVVNSSGNVTAAVSFNAPIFYDSNDTNYYLDPNGNSYLSKVRVEGISDTSYTRIVNPDGGRYVTTTSTVTGAIRIKLPTQGSGMMMTLTVKVYEYSTNRSFTIIAGGHRDGANWYNEFCYMDGGDARGELTVRFGVDGGKDCIYIGETNTSWSYPQVFVTDVGLGYVGYNVNWLTGWEVGFVTAFATVNRTQTAYRKLTPANYNSYAPTLTGGGASGTWNISISGNADTVDGYHLNQDVRTTAAPSFQYIGVNPSGASNNGYGISLYGGASAGPTYGIFFQGTSTYGTHGSVTGDWATYFTMNNDDTRGWIWRKTAASNVASLSAGGVFQINGSVRAPIFYDSQDTNYYIDGNSGSALKYLRVNGDWGSSPFGSGHETLTVTGSYASICQRSTVGAQAYVLHHVDDKWSLYIGRGSTNGSSWDWAMRAYPTQDGNHVEFRTSARAPIFYDSGDTGYYGDFAGTSNLNYLNLGNTREEFPLLRMGSAGRYALGVSGAYTRLSSHNQGSGVQLGFYDGTTFTPRLTVNNDGNVEATTSLRAPIFYDSNSTTYYGDFASVSSMYGVAIRGDQSSTDTANQIFFWGAGNTTTSAIGFKANGGAFPNPTGNGDGYNTYFTMDSNGRGWVFRRSEDGTFGNVYTSGWILNNGIWQANGSMRAPIFYDSANTGYYVDPNSTSVLYYLQLNASESMNLYGIRGRFTNEYIHLYNKVGIGHPSGWGQGEGSTPNQGLSTYGGATFAYGTGGTSTFYGHLRVTGNNNLYLDSNFGQSIVGLYSASRYQGVFAMGDSYKLPIDGASTGSLYGLAWSHPNAGGVAGNLNTHGLLVMENGTFLAAVSGSIRARDDMRAPYFYGSGSIRCGDMWGGAGLYRPSGSMVFGIENSDWIFSKGAVTQAYFAGGDGNLWMRWAGDWLSNLLGAKASTGHLHDDRYFFDYGFTTGYPGTDANSMPGNRSAFTYSNGAPYTGPIAHFGAAGYGLQLNANYGDGTLLGYRVRNGDNATWGSWRRLVWEGGTWSFSITGSAGSISGYNNPTTGATANTIVYRDGSGHISGNYIFGSYFNSSAGNSENPTIGQIWTQSTGDNYLRKSTPAHLISQLGLITSSNIGSQSVNYANSAGSASSVAWGNVSSKPDQWLNTTNLVDDYEPSATARPSGFYQSYLGSGNPTGTWFNFINVRHSNPGNGHGYQLGMSYYDNNLWFRSYQGGTSPTFQSWSRALGTNTDPYPSNMNQYVRTTDAVTFGGATINYSGSNVTAIGVTHTGSISSSQIAQGLAIGWSGYGASFAIVYKQGELSPSDMCHIYNVGGFYMKIFDGSSNRFHRWDDNGTVSINSSSQGSYTFNVTGDIYATADVIAFSDARVKEDVRTVENALDKVTKLRGVTYLKKDEDNNKRKMGVIAQEVLEVIPEVVHQDNDGFYGVAYGNIVGVLIEAIKEQQKQIDELKQELKNK